MDLKGGNGEIKHSQPSENGSKDAWISGALQECTGDSTGDTWFCQDSGEEKSKNVSIHPALEPAISLGNTCFHMPLCFLMVLCAVQNQGLCGPFLV